MSSYFSFAALCIGPLQMSSEGAIQALQVLGVSVFYESKYEEQKTVFDSGDLRETLKGIIETSGHSPEARIGTIAPNSKCRR